MRALAAEILEQHWERRGWGKEGLVGLHGQDPADPQHGDYLREKELSSYLDRYFPYICIMDDDISFMPKSEDNSEDNRVVVSKLMAGWRVKNYGNALVASPIHNHRDKNWYAAAGSLASQYQAVRKLFPLLIESNWQGYSILDGTPTLLVLAWLELSRWGLKVGGYTPTKLDLELAEKASQAMEGEGKRWYFRKPAPQEPAICIALGDNGDE